jgi:hypothetical protein
MPIGDIFYNVVNTGGNYTEVGFPSDPTSTMLPAIFANASKGQYSYNVEFYANTSVEVEGSPGEIETFAQAPIYDLEITSDPLQVTTTKLSGNSISVSKISFFNLFASEEYTFANIDTETGTVTETVMSALAASVYTPDTNEFVLKLDPPTNEEVTLTYSLNLTRSNGETPLAYTYTQDNVWSGQEALVLLNTFI